MKKIKSLAIVLLSVFLLVGAITANAETSANVTVDSVEANVGETVTVAVNVKGCGNAKSLAVIPVYDESVIEIKSGKWLLEGAILSQDWSYETGDAVIAYDNETDINGKIFEFEVAVKSGAENGTKIPISCEIVIKNEDVTYNTTVEAGSITVTKPESNITAHNMELSDDITVNYYAKVDSAHTGAEMRFTMNGKETLVSGVATDEDGVLVFPFRGVAPQCMGDNIKAELVLGDEVLDAKLEYSVRAYCDEVLSKSASELGLSDAKLAALKVLVADMLEYGAAAQIYNGYKTGALVNDGVSGKSEYAELESTDKAIDESGADGLEITGVGMYFDYVNSFYVNFTALDYAEDEMCILVYNTVTEEETEYTLADCVAISEAEGKYVLVTDAIFTTSYDDVYFIELYTYSSRGKLVCQQTLEYSVASYVYAMQNKTEPDGTLTPMAELARAVYLYGTSAAAYKNIAE